MKITIERTGLPTISLTTEQIASASRRNNLESLIKAIMIVFRTDGDNIGSFADSGPDEREPKQHAKADSKFNQKGAWKKVKIVNYDARREK